MRRMKFALIALLLATSAANAALPRVGSSAERDYILGRYAFSDDKLGDAARYFDAARRSNPADPTLGRRAFELAVAAGDEKLAVQLANQLTAAGQGEPTTALVRIAAALEKRDWKAVDAARPGLADAGYAQVVGPIVEAWTLFGRDNVDAGLARLDPTRATGFTRSYFAEQRAHMLAAAGRFAEAATAYRDLRGGSGPGINFLRIGEADALQQGGDAKAAAVVLDAVADDPIAAAARARLSAGKRIGALTRDPRSAVGWACARLATDLARDKPVPLALIFARVATFLSPDNSATWLVAGDVLARSQRIDGALTAYSQIPAGDPLFEPARARRAQLLAGSGRDEAALALLNAEASGKDADAASFTRLGDFFRRSEQPAKAAEAYSRAIALAPGGKPSWSDYFLRGSSYEQAGNWAAAEPDLRKALALAPEEPAVLNYLGYALLDRGETLDLAQTMIQKAAKLQPDDGAITDSLGWALFRRGKFAEAVPVLERAVAAQPGDSMINEHLGDAYWRAGRKIEARFRWRAALDLDPADKNKAALAAKLDYGLDVGPGLVAAR